MKAILATAVLLLCVAPTMQIGLTADFITGFESGIFLRSNPRMLEDYGCPTPHTNTEQYRQF